VAFSAVAALLAAVAVAVPAYRAAHVDPIAALKRG
jgi:ABC-type antimicrobial peptide transport system permease subunit